ncbi:hypothetical protein [Agaribacter marinus]|uniref:Uncharacterized protein n=1 Tax=Agaribacter marinus TaxID=1431249 RepID=A0AA37WH43_9ALTE|nr:hypothetical protein [Agaribacter marinus]GLR70846.1 hypothetical protein GCM10007852_17540 [Agaribacter marinus]
MHPEISLVIECCLDLYEQGKKPSVALVKARLGKQVSLPAIVTGLKKWPNAPKKEAPLSNIAVDCPPTETLSTEERIANLETKVLQLETLIQKLL